MNHRDTESKSINLFDVVALLEDLPDDNLYRGQVGTVIEVYAPDAFEVEFSDKNGITYGLQSFRADQLLRLYFEPKGRSFRD